MKVVVIDSGYSGVPSNCTSINGITIKEKQGCFSYEQDYTDRIGHGTAVVNILLDNINIVVDLFIIKIFEETLETNLEKLLAALEYCCKINCDVIQVSLGTLCSNQNLHDVIIKLSKKALIVSAFDNQNGLSYPASYEEVLGIDVSQNISDRDTYYMNTDGVIDICGKNMYFRVNGLQQKKIIVHGSSFLCSYITALLLNSDTEITSKKDAIKYFSTTAKILNSSLSVSPQPIYNKRIIKIRQAIVFPFNKEIYTIAAYEHYSPIAIIAYYDVKQSGHVGCHICDLLNYTSNNKVIKDYQNINWDDDSFDTIICGHTDKLSKLTKKDILEEIAKKCVIFNKQLIAFDDISTYLIHFPELNGWFPHTGSLNVPANRYGKLRTPNVPVLGVFGTSSHQGKMSFQIQLRNHLQKSNINVKNIGSEPQSFVFGFEYTYAFGYNSVDPLSSYEMIQVLNEEIFHLGENNCDIIIVGSQSGTVPHQLRNLGMIPLKQYYFLLGTQPDSIILFINSCDSLDYIQRTISFFYSTVRAPVICLIWTDINTTNNEQTRLNIDDVHLYFNIPVFDLKSMNMDEIMEIILKYYE